MKVILHENFFFGKKTDEKNTRFTVDSFFIFRLGDIHNYSNIGNYYYNLHTYSI